MPRRHELTDAAREKLAPLLPDEARPGEKWRDRRTVIDGIQWPRVPGDVRAVRLRQTLHAVAALRLGLGRLEERRRVGAPGERQVTQGDAAERWRGRRLRTRATAGG
jgi:hypothetical protein